MSSFVAEDDSVRQISIHVIRWLQFLSQWNVVSMKMQQTFRGNTLQRAFRSVHFLTAVLDPRNRGSQHRLRDLIRGFGLIDLLKNC